MGQEGARFYLLIVSVEGRQANAVQRREIESGMLRAMALGLDLLLMGLGSNLLGELDQLVLVHEPISGSTGVSAAYVIWLDAARATLVNAFYAFTRPIESTAGFRSIGEMLAMEYPEFVTRRRKAGTWWLICLVNN